MIDQLRALEARAIEELESARDSALLESWRTRYLGRRGDLTQILRGLGGLARRGAAAAWARRGTR